MDALCNQYMTDITGVKVVFYRNGQTGADFPENSGLRAFRMSSYLQPASFSGCA
jgi:hypothetical protein